MIEKKTLQEIYSGYLNTGRYSCFDEEAEFTFNIGYGFIDIIHFNNELLINGGPCQFAIKDNKLYFRIVYQESIVFTDMKVSDSMKFENEIIIKIDDLPISFRSMFKKEILLIRILDNNIEVINKKSNYGRSNANSPFSKSIKQSKRNIKNPFTSSNNKGFKVLNKSQCNNKRHNKNEVMYILKEENNGLFR